MIGIEKFLYFTNGEVHVSNSDVFWNGMIFMLTYQFFNQLSPGPTMAFEIGNTLNGRRVGLWSVAGVVLSSLFVKTLAVVGLDWVNRTDPAIFEMIRYMSIAYMVFLGGSFLIKGYRAWKYPEEEHPHPIMGRFDCAKSPMIAGFLINGFNPLASLTFAAVYTTFVTPGLPLSWQLAFPFALSLEVAIFDVCLVLFLSTHAIHKIFWGYRVWVDSIAGGMILFRVALLLNLA